MKTKLQNQGEEGVFSELDNVQEKTNLTKATVPSSAISYMAKGLKSPGGIDGKSNNLNCKHEILDKKLKIR